MKKKGGIMVDNKTLGLIIATKKDGGLPYLDYDLPYSEITEDVKELVDEFKLGRYAIISTKKGCHIVFDDWRSWEEIVKIMECSRKVDETFVEFKKDMGYSRIRVGNKYSVPDLKIEKIIKTAYAGKQNAKFSILMLMIKNG
jgi:hypothetical protein